MDEHPGIAFVTAPSGERVAVLAARPRLKVMDLIATWWEERQDSGATARYFDLTEDEVLGAVRYYAASRDELDAAIRAHQMAQANSERVLKQRRARGVNQTAGG